MIRTRVDLLLHNYWWSFLAASLLLTGQEAITILVYDLHMLSVGARPFEAGLLALDTALIVLFPLMVTVDALRRLPTPLARGRVIDGCLMGLTVNAILALVSLPLAIAEGILRFSVLKYIEPPLSVYVPFSLGGIVVMLISGAAMGWLGFHVTRRIDYNRPSRIR